ncbi:MAG: TRAP transporter substrate-binding protein [Treponema sp.]|nr:TRAP transporter substrate-binding protein [Candidatus Treponema equifaecale]
MKKILATFASALLSAALLILATSCGNKQTVLKLAEVHIDGYPTALADAEFARLVEKKTNGRIKIEVYTGGALYADESDSIKALIRGDVGFARVSSAPLAAYVPKINLVNLPYIFRDRDHMWKVLNSKIGDDILKEIEESDSGLVAICYYDADSRSFYTTRPIRTVADMAGLKIRMQNSEMMKDLVNYLGGTGVGNIGSTEVYSAIQNGIVDGAENNWATYENMGDYLAASYYTLDSHTRIPEMLVASKEVLSKLKPKDVEIIKSCAKEVQNFEIKKVIEKSKESEERIRDAGVTVIELTPEARKEFEDAMIPLYEKYAANFTDLIKEIKSM